LPQLAYELTSKMRHWRQDGRKDRHDGKMRKK